MQKSRTEVRDFCLHLFCQRKLVRLKGFEPPTYWFVASHSIQLSYSRILQVSPDS